MSVFFDVIAALLGYCYAFWNNYAWAISALTLIIMIVLTPLTLKGTRSMMVMQQLQPEMKKIQTRYKDDRQKQNEELLKFYKENDINPLGGCLPLFVQMPVFVVLYAVLRGLTRRTTQMGFNFGFTGGQLGKAVHLVNPPAPVIPPSGAHCATTSATPGACFDPSYLKHTTDLYQALSHTTTMKALGMDLAVNVRTAASSGAFRALPYVILIVIVGITGWVQQKQIQGRQPQNSVPQQQQAVMKIMPFFLPLISITLPAGLVLYFAVSNTYRVAQQWFIGRSLYGPGGGPGGDSAKGSGGPSPKPAKASTSSSSAPKQGRLAAAFSAATAKAEGSDQPADDAEPATATNGKAPAKNAGRPSAKPKAGSTSARAKSTAATKAADKAPTKSTTRSSKSTNGSSKSGAKAAPKRSGSAANGDTSKTASPSGGSANPVLQPRARKKKG